MFLTDLWYFAAFSAQVKPGEMIRRVIADGPVLLGRGKDGKVFALRDICPHRGMTLSTGVLHEEKCGPAVECPYHGWRFGTDGRCSSIPSLTEEQRAAMDVGRIGVRAYPVHEAQGLIFIYLGADENAPPLMNPPRLDLVGDSAPKIREEMFFDCALDHAVIGLMDPAHISFIHRQWWWRTAKSIHKKEKAFGPVTRGFSMLPHSPSSNSFLYRLLGAKPRTEIRFQLPGIRVEYIEVGARQVTGFTAVTPVDKGRTRISIGLYWSHPLLDVIPNALTAKGIRIFAGQDRDAVNAQQAGLKYDPKLMLIHDADVQAMWYFKLKEAWAQARANDTPFENPVKPATLRWRS